MAESEWTVRARQPHSLPRDEAKRRIAEKITVFIGNHASWRITGSWTSEYTYDFTCSGAGFEGVSGEIKVWAEQAVINMMLPPDKASYAGLVEQKAEEKLRNVLA